ncbi:MAG: hypothetical protein MRY49_01460 [Candidatus Pacebacteria bacterium]|nr:hypothetical protein [Candidatus Paceibacterota bacterium]
MSSTSVGFVARVRVFFQEFPFLNRYVEIRTLDEKPVVRRVNLDLLDERANEAGWFEWIDGFTHHCQVRKFFIIGSDGEELATVTPSKTMRVLKRYLRLIPYDQEEKVIGETVYEALMRLPEIDKVHFIVEVGDRWNRVDDEDYDHGVIVTVHKIPAGIPFSEWVGDLEKIARNELSAEMTKVNSVI